MFGFCVRRDLILETFHVGVIGSEDEAIGVADEYLQSSVPSHLPIATRALHLNHVVRLTSS